MKYIYIVLFTVWAMLFIPSLGSELSGIHSHRQADTLFTAHSYCFEGTEFLLPKIIHRGNTSGIAIGEFPLFSYLLSLPCKISGVWNEKLERVIVLFIFLLCMLVWGKYLELRNILTLKFWQWSLLFWFATINQQHLTIPIPDGLALLLVGLSGVFFKLSDKAVDLRRSTGPGELFNLNKIIFIILSIVIFVLAFAIRPYLLPLLILVIPSWAYVTFVLFLCAVFYFWWFKYWIFNSDIAYYSTELRTPSELLIQMPRAVLSYLRQMLNNHLNVIGIVPFIFFIRKNMYWLLFLLLSVLFVLLGKGDHVVNHGYYLYAPGLIGLLIMTFGLQEFTSEKNKNIFLILYVLIGIGNAQHLWIKNNPDEIRIKEEVQRNNVQPNQKIAVFIEDNPMFLYWAKRVGWIDSKNNFHGPSSCPSGADFYMIKDEQMNNQIMIGECVWKK